MFINKYNKYKKLGRYITAYLLWLYSKFLHETDKPVSLGTMFEFQQQHIEIIPNWEYNGSVGKMFDIDNKVIMRNKKLIVKSEETLKRLMYVLRINTVKIPDYYKKAVIENYYEDVTDFDPYQFQIILQGEYSVEKWIDEHNSKNKLRNYIDPDLETPYFFKNSLIGEQIFLAQNTDSQSKAIVFPPFVLIANIISGINIIDELIHANHPNISFMIFEYYQIPSWKTNRRY